MTIIGVTGISGSGKTTVTRMLAKMGGYTIEADPLAHMAMRKGQPAHKEIVNVFGTDILDETGEISRPALGKLVFENKKKLAKLESIIHPKVIALTTALIAHAKTTGKYKFAVIDAALLVEAKMHKTCHHCWLITASHDTRLARIIARDNITKEAAEKRLASRSGDEALKPHATTIIENNDDLKTLQSNVRKALKSSLASQGATK